MPAEEIDYDAMNDDEFLAASEDVPMFEPIVDDKKNEEESDTEKNLEKDGDIEESADTDDDETSDQDEDTQNDGNDDEDSDDGEDSKDDDDKDESGESGSETDDDDGHKESDKDKSSDKEFDFKSSYEEILAPFKANGREIKVDSVEDVRQLMKMGAGFSKNMQKLNQHLKIVKSLKDNDLLDQSKLDNLIEASKGNQQAIAKLVKDGGIEPIDINTDGAETYKAKSHEVSDADFNLDQAIDMIRDDESFEKSMKVMGEQWDQGSREIISKNPEIVTVVNEHIKNGIFDKVSEYIDNERMLGRMQNMSDVEAYRVGVQALQKSGVLVDGKKENKDSEKNSLKDEVKDIASKKKVENTKKKKKAAAPSGKGAGGEKAQKDLSKLNDEEFLKEFEKL